MKMFKKIIALLAVICVMSSSVTVFAAFSAITVEQSAAEVKAGETITIDATFDSLVDAQAMSVTYYYDDTAFTVDTTNDEAYNFGNSRNPVYWPNYMPSYMKEAKKDGIDAVSPFYGAGWSTFAYSNPKGEVNYLSYDSGNYTMTEGDDKWFTDKTVGVIFTAKDDIAAGEYTFTIKAIVSDANKGDVVSEKTVTVTVAGDEPTYTYEDATTSTKVEVAKNENFTDVFNDAIIATASVPANTTAEDFGIIFLNNGVKAKDKETGELAHISMMSGAVEGEGTYEFGVVMYGIPEADMANITAQYYIYE